MYKTAPDVGPYFAAFARAAPPPEANVTTLFFPPFPLLAAVGAAIGGLPQTALGAQTCHWEREGPFTGEVSAPAIAACGARFVLVGHSERREHSGETDAVCAAKLRAALAAGLEPLLCVGETLAEREAGQARAVVLRQLTRAADGLDRAEYARLAVAYEPVWAIGTGRTAAPADAQEMHAAIRDVLRTVATPDLADRMPILYGGSVKPENAAALLAGRDVDGALVGGASLDPVAFARILAAQ